MTPIQIAEAFESAVNRTSVDWEWVKDSEGDHISVVTDGGLREYMVELASNFKICLLNVAEEARLNAIIESTEKDTYGIRNSQ